MFDDVSCVKSLDCLSGLDLTKYDYAIDLNAEAWDPLLNYCILVI